MMTTIQNILIIDDHPITIDAYINLIASNKLKEQIVFHKAVDCHSAFGIIKQFEKLNNLLDVALIDISIPAYNEGKLFSGIEVALLIKDLFPMCIIIILTMHTEPLLLFNIHKSVKSNGFISKLDIDSESFLDVYENIIKGDIIYSPTINNALQYIFRQTIKWDEHDTKIIFYLKKGIQTKQLPQYIKLSLSAIEKRKAILKSLILDRKASDIELIEKCKTLKLI